MFSLLSFMRSYRDSSHTAHDLRVHLIWITKYRYKVLTKDVGVRIHLYISYSPKLSVSDMVRIFQGRSSRKIQDEFPQLGKVYWGKPFWVIGYAAFSSGHVTDEMIQEYLAYHDNHPNHNDDEFRVE